MFERMGDTGRSSGPEIKGLCHIWELQDDNRGVGSDKDL